MLECSREYPLQLPEQQGQGKQEETEIQEEKTKEIK